MTRLTAVLFAAVTLALAPAAAVAQEPGEPTFPPRGPDCKVPEVLVPVMAQVYSNSVTDCGYFEDPNYQGSDGPLGLGKLVFGPIYGPDAR